MKYMQPYCQRCPDKGLEACVLPTQLERVVNFGTEVVETLVSFGSVMQGGPVSNDLGIDFDQRVSDCVDDHMVNFRRGLAKALSSFEFVIVGDEVLKGADFDAIASGGHQDENPTA